MRPFAAVLALTLAAAGCDDPPPHDVTVPDEPEVPAATLPGGVRTAALTPAPIRVTLADLPAPFATTSASKGSRVVDVPADPVINVPAGFAVQVFASGLSGPRTLAVTPEGDVLVAESNASRITRLRDADGDGVAEARDVVATDANGISRPFGMGFVRGRLYVASTGSVDHWAWPGRTGALAGTGTRIATLPTGGHWTRGLAVDRDSAHLFVSVGSRSNVDVEPLPRAAILRMGLDGSGSAVYASGLRNAVDLAIDPATGALATVVNERDGLGDDLVPDYLATVREGAFYGWPYAYLAPANLDPRRVRGGQSENPADAARTVTPDVLLVSHSAPLGLAFGTRLAFPERYRSGAFVALHGSWNRSAGTGYKVVFAPIEGGRFTGAYEDFLTGFLTDPSGPTTWGRPVGVAVAKDGALLVSEDGNGRIYRISHRPR